MFFVWEGFPSDLSASFVILWGLVPDEVVLKLLKKAMVKHQDTNRFLLDGFPRSVEQAQCFERDIAEAAGGCLFSGITGGGIELLRFPEIETAKQHGTI